MIVMFYSRSFIKFNNIEINLANTEEMQPSWSKNVSTEVSDFEIAEDDYNSLHHVIMGTKVDNIITEFTIKALSKMVKDTDDGNIN